MRVVFASARSSPGVTTAVLACASVWPGRLLLVEASEDGGALAARFGLPIEPGLTTLAAASRHTLGGDTAGLLDEHVRPLPGTGRIGALVGPAALEPAQALLRTCAGRLAGLLESAETDVLIDAGRLPAAPLVAPLIESADRLVLVVRPRVEELAALAHRLAHLSTLGPAPDVLLVGDRPYGPAEVADAIGAPVLGVLAADPDAADALAACGTARWLGRSALLRTASGIVDRVAPSRPAPQPDVGTSAQVDGHPRGRDLVHGRS
ncbi:chromosome partitioning protein [Egicoccus sp. AB-alg6-2]|uniref:chromosome partitioning protein n=1 Tax=Egicoccus sp. AB-alg6-2 TaxID=3242692 RepID=UPI00359D53ED